MDVSSFRRLIVVGCLFAVGCRGFRVADFPDLIDLYRESMRRLEAGDERNAILGFERLTLELPARDTLLPRSHFYLGKAHANSKAWLQASEAYTRMAALFPDDSLADDALLEAARAYARIWDDPELDPTYGESAIAVYSSLVETFPNSPLRAEAERGIAALQAQLAEKDYITAEYYRPRSVHSAIIYYKQLIDRYPSAPRVRDAYARMAEAYKSIEYEEDYKETCEAARTRFPEDAVIGSTCSDAAKVPSRNWFRRFLGAIGRLFGGSSMSQTPIPR
jgi:outer membrane protein assembly factor BamD